VSDLSEIWNVLKVGGELRDTFGESVGSGGIPRLQPE